MTNIFSSWSPLDLILPTVDSDTEYGIWYVTDGGSIEGLNINFSVGDWLIYIKKGNAANWYKQSGGVAVFDTKSSRNIPEAGIYTRFRLDNNGNIINADYIDKDDLPSHKHKLSDISEDDFNDKVINIVKEMFQDGNNSSVDFTYHKSTKTITAEVNIDDETIHRDEWGQIYADGVGSGSGSGGSHGTAQTITGKISISQVEDLSDRLSALDAEIKKNYIVTTLGSGIDVKRGIGGTNISAKVDGTTIVLNSLGELSLAATAGVGEGGLICGNHTHSTSQITDLEEYVLALIKKSKTEVSVNDLPIDGDTIIINKDGKLMSVAAATQAHNHIMKDITDLNPDIANVWASDQELKGNYTGHVNLNNQTIGYAVNIFNQSIEDIYNKIGSLESTLSFIEVPEPNTLEFADINTFLIWENKVYDVITQEEVSAGANAKFDIGLFYPANKGTFEVLVDDVSTFSIEFNNETFLSSKNGFRMTKVQDSYQGNPVYKDVYKSMTVSYELSDIDNVTEGIHTIQFVHRFDDKESFSKKVTFNIYNNNNPTIVVDPLNLPQNNIWVSGNRKYNGDGIVTFTPIIKGAYVNRFAANNILKYKIDNKDFIELKPYQYSGGDAYFQQVSIELEKYKNQSSTITLVSSNKKGTELSKDITTNYLFWDTTDVETYRVAYSTELFNQEPQTIGGLPFHEYDSQTMVNNYELMLENNIGKLITKSYTTGVDYTNYQYDQEGYVWANFRLPCKYMGNIHLVVQQEYGMPFERNKNGTLKNIKLYASQSSDNITPTQWINLNKPFVGNGGAVPLELDFGGLDLFRSSGKDVYGTWGQSPTIRTGFLYLKVGVKNTIDLGALIESAKESIKEWN